MMPAMRSRHSLLQCCRSTSMSPFKYACNMQKPQALPQACLKRGTPLTPTLPQTIMFCMQHCAAAADNGLYQFPPAAQHPVTCTSDAGRATSVDSADPAAGAGGNARLDDGLHVAAHAAQEGDHVKGGVPRAHLAHRLGHLRLLEHRVRHVLCMPHTAPPSASRVHGGAHAAWHVTGAPQQLEEFCCLPCRCLESSPCVTGWAHQQPSHCRLAVGASNCVLKITHQRFQQKQHRD